MALMAGGMRSRTLLATRRCRYHLTTKAARFLLASILSHRCRATSRIPLMLCEPPLRLLGRRVLTCHCRSKLQQLQPRPLRAAQPFQLQRHRNPHPQQPPRMPVRSQQKRARMPQRHQRTTRKPPRPTQQQARRMPPIAQLRQQTAQHKLPIVRPPQRTKRQLVRIVILHLSRA